MIGKWATHKKKKKRATDCKLIAHVERAFLAQGLLNKCAAQHNSHVEKLFLVDWAKVKKQLNSSAFRTRSCTVRVVFARRQVFSRKIQIWRERNVDGP